MIDTIVAKTMHAVKEKEVSHLIIAGGVAANKGLRKALQEACEKNQIHLTIPAMKYCTDNATMIAAAGYYAYRKGRIASLDLNSKSTDDLK